MVSDEDLRRLERPTEHDEVDPELAKIDPVELMKHPAIHEHPLAARNLIRIRNGDEMRQYHLGH